MLTVFQAFSQFERELIAQHTREGIESARERIGEAPVLRIALLKRH